MKTTLDSQGRVQLPGEIQTQLGVKPGDAVILESQPDQCVIRPDRTESGESGLCWKENILVHQGVTAASTDACIRQARDERLDHLSEGFGE